MIACQASFGWPQLGYLEKADGSHFLELGQSTGWASLSVKHHFLLGIIKKVSETWCFTFCDSSGGRAYVVLEYCFVPEMKELIGQLLTLIKRDVTIVRSSSDFFSRMCLKTTCGIPAHTTET